MKNPIPAKKETINNLKYNILKDKFFRKPESNLNN